MSTAATLALWRSLCSGHRPEWYFVLIGDGPHATVAANEVATTSPTRNRIAPGFRRPIHAIASTVPRITPTSTNAE